MTLPLIARSRASILLDVDARTAWERFCDAERIPEWLQHVRVLRVERRYPFGMAEEVLFESAQGGQTRSYALHYVYDLKGLRVAWRTPQSAARNFRGNAIFTPIGQDRSELLYSIYEPEDSSALPNQDAEARAAYANSVVESFKRWVEAEVAGETREG